MENVNFSKLSASELISYVEEHNLSADEHEIAMEILAAIQSKDQQQLDFFQQFGSHLYATIMNIHSYRHGLDYGFTKIAFDEYSWLQRARFLDQEEFTFGDAKRLNSESRLEIGRGPNGKWTYGLWCSYGTAGSYSGLCVYDEPQPSRQAAIDTGLAELKAKFSKVLGNPDTLNYKQAVIVKTLADIEAFKADRIQLSLF